MKLIDIDAFRADHEMAEACENCTRDSHACGMFESYTMQNFCEMLDEAPILEAIPISWLEKKRDTAIDVYSDYRTADCITKLLKEWEERNR